VVLFPNGKINIGLNITSKRADGYHNIETIFYPVHWYDVLEVVNMPVKTTGNTPADLFQLHISGLIVPGNPQENICVKAFELLRADFPHISPVNIFLHKAIPAGAGLGGGSADGAFMLRLLNEKHQLHLPDEQLLGYAARLGSDCAFFINNTPCFATSRGELLEPLSLDLSGYTIVLVNPGIHVNTAWAFSAITPGEPVQSLKKMIQLPIEDWKNNIRNDFETAVFSRYAEIGNIKQMLYHNGAVYAAMSGSGSTVYGFFHKNAVPKIEWQKNYIQKIIG